MSLNEFFSIIGTAFSWPVITMLFIGTASGIIIGAIPGLTATMAIALLVPLSYGQPILKALGLLLGIYIGGMYGGSLSAILINVPGAPCSAATALDGYPLTKKGMAGKAIFTATIASVFGGLVSTLILILFSVSLAKGALHFSSPEFFLIAIFGLTMVISLTTTSISRGFVSALFGSLIATVGLDYMVPLPRFTFGSVSLLTGFPIVPVLIGVFAFAQVFHMIEEEPASYFDIDFKKQLITLKEFKGISKTLVRSSIIGTLVGIIPAAGPNIAAFLGYSEAKRNSQHPERFGTGEIDGIAASEAANNAVPAGALVPLLVFGIPGDTVTAILLGAFILQGIQPGPLLFVERLDIVYPIFAMLIIANIFLLFLGIAGMSIFPKILSKISNTVLLSIVGVFSVVGGFTYSGRVSDAIITIIFGIFGYLFIKSGFSVVPLSLTIILGPLIEVYFRQSLILSKGNFLIFFTRPISIVLWFLIIFGVYASFKITGRIAK